MQNINEIFNRINEIKKEQKKIRDMYKDALSHSAEYQDALAEWNKIKENKKQIETNIKTDFSGEIDRMDRLKQEMTDSQQMLCDIAITQYSQGQSIEIKDDYNNTYEPVFSVKFKKV